MTAAREMYSRAAWTAGFALILYYNSRVDDPGPAFRVLAVLLLLALGFVAAGYAIKWLNTTGQARVREQILDTVALTGAERVLDVGGTLGMAIAQRLKSGKAIAIGDPAFNETERELAKNQGFADRLRFESGSPEKLSYPDANFDVVLSSRALQQLDPAARERAVAEMVRVLKPGGRLVIHEIGDAVPATDSLPLTGVFTTPSSLPLGLGGSVVSATKA